MIHAELNRLYNIYGPRFKQHSDESLNFISFVIDHFKNKSNLNIIEIGMCYGANLVFMGNVLVKYNKKIKAVGIDYPNQEKWGGHAIDPKIEILRGLPKFNYDIIIGDSHKQETINQLKNIMPQIDLLFIDGDHSEQGCRHDFELYSPFVNKGGLIAFHDIVPHKPWPHVEVWKVWQNIKHLYEYKEFAGHEQYGIGVIKI